MPGDRIKALMRRGPATVSARPSSISLTGWLSSFTTQRMPMLSSRVPKSKRGWSGNTWTTLGRRGSPTAGWHIAMRSPSHSQSSGGSWSSKSVARTVSCVVSRTSRIVGRQI